MLILSTRYWRTWVRNPIMMWSELMQYTFMAGEGGGRIAGAGGQGGRRTAARGHRTEDGPDVGGAHAFPLFVIQLNHVPYDQRD